MVANTSMKTLSETWSQVSADGVTECYVTLEGTRANQAVIRVAATQPAASVADGVRLTALLVSLPITGLSSSQKVWARAVSGSAILSVH